MTTTVTAKIQLRKGTAAAWTSANPVLLSGEVGFETDTLKLKIGDGTTAWTSLAYHHDPDLAATYAAIAHTHSGVYEPADATLLKQVDVDDTPVNGVTTAPVSSNWAYDHAALTTAHGISSFGATLVDDADASTARSTLGLGTAAVAASGDFATSAHNHSGVYDPAGTAASAVSTHAGGSSVHAIASVTGLQTALDGKSATSHDHAATYAPLAKGVTNGDSHDHNGGDGAQIAYSGLSGLPTLGTAAATDSTAYATAAQGSTADSAMQPGDDAADLGSGAATDNYVLTADGTGGAAWEAAAVTYAGAASEIHAATDKATPVDADELGLVDSAASFVLKKLTWANLKTTLSSVFAVLAGKSGGQTLIGGTGVADKLVLQGTSGNGTATATALEVKVGNNGATSALNVLNNGQMGIGTTSPSALIHGIKTTEQLRLGYDTTNFLSLTVGSTGILALNPTSGQLTVKGAASTDLPAYSAEFLLSTGWTSTDWTGDFATGWTHTVGNTTALSQSKSAANATKYQIAYTVTNRTAGSFTITFGGQSNPSLTATGTWGPTTSSTASLTITPTSDFDGTVVISIKSITAVSAPNISFLDSSGTNRCEIRTGNASQNTFIGLGAGAYNTTGGSNTANGVYALRSNTTGSNNTANGVDALYYNTTGSNNTASGISALRSNTTGYNNTASGISALRSNTTGYNNTAEGYQAGDNLTTGSQNLILGYGVDAPSATDNGQLVIGNLIFGTGVTGTGTTIAGLCGIGTNAPDARLHAVSTTEQLRLGYDASNYARFTVGSTGTLTLTTSNNKIILGASRTPASASDTGAAGEMCWDASYLYVCVSSNTWKRAALSTW